MISICCISVFLDKEKSYDYLKDVQSCGAVMQNILLATHGLGLGGCWIGEVLRFQDEIMHMLQISQEIYELMGMIVIGYTIQMIQYYIFMVKEKLFSLMIQ